MRARSIKPGICDNELLGTADPFCTLLFERLWMMADREGRLEDRPLRIKAQAFPYREGLDIEALLRWLDEHDFIQRYVADGVRYIQVIKFLGHQKPHQNEKPSVIPAPGARTTIEASTTKAPSEHNQGTKHLALTPSSLTPDSGLLTPDCLMSPSETLVALERDGRALTVFAHWQREWKHPSSRLDAKRKKRIEARLKDFTPEQLCEAISGFKHSDWHTGQDPKGNGTVYDSLDTLLRDTAQVDKGLQLFAHPPRPPPRQLSPVERARAKLESVSNGNGRVVSEQFGGTGDGGMDAPAGLLRRIPDS